MWAIVLLLILLVLMWVVGRYTHVLTPRQMKFLQISTVMYVIIIVFFGQMLLSEGGPLTGADMQKLFSSSHLYFPLFFFIAWFFISASISNLLAEGQDYMGFFSSQNRWVSDREEMNP